MQAFLILLSIVAVLSVFLAIMSFWKLSRGIRAHRDTRSHRKKEERKVEIVHLLKAEKHAGGEARIKNDAIEEMFQISDSTATRYLEELVHEGKLKKHGKTGRGVYYALQ